MEACDWRTKISKDLREKIVKRIIDILRKRSPPSEQSLSQLKKIQKVAENFEEKVYMDASDQKEYMRKIMVKLMAAEGSHPNVVPTSSSNAPYFGLKASNLVGNQGQSSAVQSTDQSQACEVPEKHLLPDVRNNMASAGVSANLASARITVSASPQVPLPNSASENSYLLKLLGNSSGKGIPSNESGNNFKQEQEKQHSSRIDAHQNPHLCKQVKQELIAPPCITWQQQVQQQQHHQHQQKLLKHTLQQTSQQSVIQAPLARSSEIHVPLSDRQLDQISSLEQTSESVIKNPLQTAFGQTTFGQTNPQDTPEIRQTESSAPEHQLMQSQKQQHLMGRRLTATNLQQNQLSGHPNSLRDWQQQHHRLPLQHNNLQQEFKGKNIILSSANNEDQRNNISVLHGSSQLPETQGTSSGKHPCEVKMQETRQTALALLSNQVLKSQPQSLERQLNFQAQPENMQNLLNSEKMQISGIPASTFEQRVSNIDNFQEEVYRKVEVLKSKYLTALTNIDQRVTSYFQKLNSVPQHPDRGNIKKLKAVKHMHCTVKFYIMNLNVPKSKIKPGCEEKLGLLEDKIISFLHIFEQRKPATLLQHGKFSSDMHSMPQLVQLHSQTPLVQTPPDEKKLQSQSVNVQCFGTKMQHSNVTNLVNGSDSLSEPPILQHDMMYLQQNLTEQDSEANTLNLVHQVPSGSFKLPKSSPQQTNDMLSRNPALRPRSQVNPLKSRFSTLQDMHLKQTKEQPDVRTENPKQELQRHKSQQQQQPLKLQSGDLTPNPLPKSLNPSCQQVPPYSSVSEKNNLMMPPRKARSPFISRSSAEARISSLAPIASAPIPGDAEKPMSETALLSNVVNIGGQQATGAPEALSGTPLISASPLLEQSNGDVPCSFDGLNAAEQPIQRLIKLVNLMSCNALSSSASDIGSVVCMTDRVCGSATVQGPRAVIGDLADVINFHLQERNSAWQEKTVERRIMKRCRSLPISYGASETDGINGSFSWPSDMEKCDLDSPAISYIKRRRLVVNHILLEEITAINQRLIDTVLDISDEETVPSVASAPILDGEGTIVRCSLSAVAIAANLKSERVSAPMLPIQPLRLLVPANYPSCSPIFLDKLKVEVSDELEDLSAKVTSKLNLSLRTLTEPLSLGEIARTWDVCARAVISEYAEQNGGGSFSSKYGTWEDCLSAAAA